MVGSVCEPNPAINAFNQFLAHMHQVLSLTIDFDNITKSAAGTEALLEPEMECAAGWRLPMAWPK